MSRAEAVREAVKRFPELVRQPYADMLLAKDGYDAVNIFAGRMHGMSTYIPTLRTIVQDSINAALVEDYDKGATVQQLTMKYGYTDTYIRGVLR